MKVNIYLRHSFISKAYRSLILVLFIVLFIITGANSSELGYNFIDDRKNTEIRFQLINNLIVVPVTINEELTLKFILDTGMRSPMLLNTEIAEELNMEYARAVLFSGPGSKNFAKGFVVNGINLQFSGVIARGMSMIVLDKDYLASENFPIPVHGVFGYGLFSRFVVNINYEEKKLILHDPDTYIPNPTAQWLPIKVQDTKPFVQTSITLNDGTNISTTLLVDTGAATGLVLNTNSNEKIKVPRKSKKKYLGRGLGGKITGNVGKIRKMKISDHELVDFRTAFTRQEIYPTREIFMETHGSIGGKILSQFNIILDYVHGRLYLVTNKNYKHAVASR